MCLPVSLRPDEVVPERLPVERQCDLSLAYALYRGDIRSIGISGDRIPISILYGTLLFLAVLPFLYLPRRLGIRNQLEEAIALNLGPRDILALNLAVSCSEELFFRGFLLGIIGVIPSAIIFGAMHYIGYNGSKLERELL